jgi:16S rRNA (adenine1518-N6/adenine1519-N6)-dimethyltransferase
MPLPRARKRFGQHFLEPAWVAKLLDAVSPAPDDVFLEIGPGRGALTKPLATRVHRLVAVEIDRDLAAHLRAELPSSVRVTEGDFLEANLDDLLRDEPKPVRVVGNLPYNVSSPILFKLLRGASEGRLLNDATLMLQKEVADRLVAEPGTGEYGVLAIQVALLADVERILTLPPGAFRPPPKVTSAVVRLRFRPQREDVGDLLTFERLVRGIFLQRRKTTLNALKPVAESFGHSAARLLAGADVDGSKRPGELTLRDIARLSRVCYSFAPKSLILP